MTVEDYYVNRLRDLLDELDDAIDDRAFTHEIQVRIAEVVRLMFEEDDLRCGRNG